MSKIYEALENAEKENAAGLKKKPSLALESKEKMKAPLAAAPKEEKKTLPCPGTQGREDGKT